MASRTTNACGYGTIGYADLIRNYLRTARADFKNACSYSECNEEKLSYEASSILVVTDCY
jgi:hypothetical protein